MGSVNGMEQMAEVLANRTVKFQERVLKGIDVLTTPLDTTSNATPKDEVLAVDRWKLYRYRPLVEKPAPVPVLIFYALVNRYYMIDIQPDRSMVKKFLEAGLDVYVVDWGHPSRGDRYLTMEDYIDGYMNQAVDYVRRRSGQEAITLYGICQGGTFSTIYTALHPEKVSNLAIMVTPIDFHTDTGLLNVWSQHLDPDRMVETFGNVPGDFMNVGFLLLNPLRLIYQKYIDFVDHVDNRDFVANFVRMEKWIFDSPAQAGEAYKQFIKSCYQENRLIKGELELGGRRVDLQQITQPVLNVFGEKDHLVPPACSRPFTDLVASEDKTVLSFPTGHIGLFTSSRSQKEYAPKIAGWLAEHCRPQQTKAVSETATRKPLTKTKKAAPGPTKKPATAARRPATKKGKGR